MAALLRFDSFPQDNIKEVLLLDADAAAAATSLTVNTNQGLAANDPLYVGALGAEGCERVAVASLTGATTVTVSAPGLTIAHKRFETITAVYGDHLRIYRAANVDGTVPATASFSLITTQDIDPDQQSTYYRDTTGSSSYWYKATYYLGATGFETDIADSTAFRGDDYSHYASINNIRRTAGFSKNYNVQDSLVDEKRRAAEGEINAALKGFYTVPFTSVPDLITEITVELAAGLVLLTQYGSINDGSGKDGDKKVKYARSLLTRLQGQADADGNPPIYLTDYLGDAVARTSVISSWPDTTTADAALEDGGSTRAFRIGMKF